MGPPEPIPSASTFVGSNACASCHQRQFDEWQGSDHHLAMQVATSKSVLGDFSAVTVPYFDTTATFFGRDDDFFVSIETGDGESEEFRITHTFGVTPLQQYLVDAPGGRMQALQYAWDSRAEADGGQRWYHLYPGEFVGAGDPLHWTGRLFNWNYMCAECHSTNVELGYDVDTDSFATTYSEISVGCEACHGPGSSHVAQAAEESFDDAWGLLVNLDDRNTARWSMNPETGIAERSAPNVSRQQSESCGRCHARRATISPEYRYGARLTQTHMPALLDEFLYYPDGRIQDEVYVYGSFVQSRMHAAGVTCSDCHNPHSGELHAGTDPNAVCASCHAPTRFATADHAPEAVGQCVDCHMPSTVYMGVDARRDHSFRIPGTGDDPDHYGAVIAAGRNGSANSTLLAGAENMQYPPIARATMLTLLEPVEDKKDWPRLLGHLDDADPLVRIGALRALRQQPPELRMRNGSQLLRDPVLAVRVEAAQTYIEARDLLPHEDSRAFPGAANEYHQSLITALPMPEAAINLADFESRLGNATSAARMFDHAIRIGAGSALVNHAYGLFLVRSGRPDDALVNLRRATEIDATTPRYVYVYGVALNSLARTGDAIRVLTDARQRFPDDFDIAWALATMLRDVSDTDKARVIANELVARFPESAEARALLRSLD